MLITLPLFLIGFYILIKGANFLVSGSTYLARKFNISNIVIGLVIAGIGTSIPEFAVSFLANITGKSGVGLGTIIGSNTFNILFILGVSALFFPLKFKADWVKRDFSWNIFSVLVAILFAYIVGFGEISRVEGAAMLALFLIWLYIAIKKSNEVADNQEQIRTMAFPLAAILIFAGLVGVILGGKWVVDGGIEIAKTLGASNALIGLTIVGIGTSLPELAVSFIAAYKKQPGIAVGNIIGSNIFDFLMILGFGAMFKPIISPASLLPDMIITALATTLLFASMFVGEKYTLKRWEGLVFILLYAAYLIYLLK